MEWLFFHLDGGWRREHLGRVLSIKAVPKKLTCLLFCGLAVRLVWAWLPEKYLFYFVSDDAYYYFTTARNLATRGMLSADGITLTNGFHPLWLFVITPIFGLFKAHPWLGIHSALTFSAICDTAAGFLIYKTFDKFRKPATGFWTTIFYLLNPYSLWMTMNGLETALNNFFMAGLVYFAVAFQEKGWRESWLELGAFSGLAFLSRTDNIFAIGTFWAFLLWRRRDFSAFAKAASCMLLISLPWLVYNFSTFGTLVQTSGTAYPFLNHAQYLAEHQSYFSPALIPYLARLGFSEFVLNTFHYGLWPGALLIGVVLVYQLVRRPGDFRALGWTLLAVLLFSAFHLFIRWSVRPWYAQAVFVLTLPVVALAFEKTNRYLLVFGAVLILFLSAWRVQAEPFRLAERSYVILDVVENLIPSGDRVGVFNSGFVQYFTDRKVINLDGLVNNEVGAFYRERRGLAYLRERKIGWVVDHWVYLTKTFGPYWGPKARSEFVVTDIAPDISYPGNSVFVVKYLDGSPRPPYGKRLEIDSLPPPKSWMKIPLYPKF